MNKEQPKYAICRPYDGITINEEVEYAIDDNGDVFLFDSKDEAWAFLEQHNLPEEELGIIRVVEYEPDDGDE